MLQSINKPLVIFALAGVSQFLTGCNPDNNSSTSSNSPPPQLSAKINASSIDSLEALLEKQAQQKGLSGEELYNTILFSKNVSQTSKSQQYYQIDGYCTLGSAPAGSLNAQIRATVCKQAYSDYFSYANFIKAAAQYPQFAANGNDNARYTELAAFLATVAQETNGVATDEGNFVGNGGLYYRWEVGAVGQLDYTAAPRAYTVFVKGSGDNQVVNLQYLIMNGGALTLNEQGQYTINWQVDVLSLTKELEQQGYKPTTMDTLLAKELWFGMGPLQLTGDKLYWFFQYYYWRQNQGKAEGEKILDASFKDFHKRFLTDGELAWEGAFWYWTIQRKDPNSKTLSYYFSSAETNPMCKGIGMATAAVNGGCNDYKPRARYYQYFAQVFNVTTPDRGGSKLDPNICYSAWYSCDYTSWASWVATFKDNKNKPAVYQEMQDNGYINEKGEPEEQDVIQ